MQESTRRSGAEIGSESDALGLIILIGLVVIVGALVLAMAMGWVV